MAESDNSTGIAMSVFSQAKIQCDFAKISPNMTYDNVWTLGFYAGETLLPMTEAFLSDSVDKLGLLNFVVTAITYVMSYN